MFLSCLFVGGDIFDITASRNFVDRTQKGWEQERVGGAHYGSCSEQDEKVRVVVRADCLGEDNNKSNVD